MENETLLNNYFNKGGYNNPSIVGYVMKSIRDLRPFTLEEWKSWYLNNVRDEAYLRILSKDMWLTIPENPNISEEDCYNYICDVIFTRTFNGFNKEKQALNVLRKTISPAIEESPAEWDSKYFIDFYGRTAKGQMLGIQLKPETFYLGQYQNKVDIYGKMRAFRNRYDAKTYILAYKNEMSGGTIKFVDPEVVSAIRSQFNL